MDEDEVHEAEFVIGGVRFLGNPDVGEVATAGGIGDRDAALVPLVGGVGREDDRLRVREKLSVAIARAIPIRFDHAGGFRGIDAVIAGLDQIGGRPNGIEMGGVAVDLRLEIDLPDAILKEGFAEIVLGEVGFGRIVDEGKLGR